MKTRVFLAMAIFLAWAVSSAYAATSSGGSSAVDASPVGSSVCETVTSTGSSKAVGAAPATYSSQGLVTMSASFDLTGGSYSVGQGAVAAAVSSGGAAKGGISIGIEGVIDKGAKKIPEKPTETEEERVEKEEKPKEKLEEVKERRMLGIARIEPAVMPWFDEHQQLILRWEGEEMLVLEPWEELLPSDMPTAAEKYEEAIQDRVLKQKPPTWREFFEALKELYLFKNRNALPAPVPMLQVKTQPIARAVVAPESLILKQAVLGKFLEEGKPTTDVTILDIVKSYFRLYLRMLSEQLKAKLEKLRPSSGT